MEVIIQPNAEAASAVAAGIVAGLLRKKPNAVLGLATGGTPLLLYRDLIGMHRQGQIDFSGVTTFNLDEYVGLEPEHPQSYHRYMWENFFQHINIDKKKVNLPDGVTKDIPAFCGHYEEQIRAAGGIDLQILGLGTDGHIGFNMPSSSLASRTRLKTITAQTRKDNARFFGREEEVPYHVITMGIGTIMEARQCLLLAFGTKKAMAVSEMVEGPITAMNPASVLQMHPSVNVCLDQPAASQLKKADYYCWVYENKPLWQRD